MTTSILNDIKHTLGLLAQDESFDQDIMLFVNGEISDLTQIGVGDPLGFMIEDAEATWDQWITDPRLNSVKSYIFLSVKLKFDPPPTGFATAAMERQLEQMQFRINTAADYEIPPDPNA